MPSPEPVRTPARSPTAPWVALLLLLPAPTLGTAAALILWPDGLFGKMLFGAAKIWIVLLPLVWTVWVDRQSLGWSPANRGGFGVATLLGLAIAVVILAGYIGARHIGLISPELISERAAHTGLNEPAVFLSGAIYWITLNSLMEEYVWRWFVFRQFERLIAPKAAVIATSVAFTAHHVVALAAQFSWPITVLGSCGVFTGGLVWSWLYLRYRSVWPCYLSHALVDAPIFLIGYDLIFLRGG